MSGASRNGDTGRPADGHSKGLRPATFRTPIVLAIVATALSAGLTLALAGTTTDDYLGAEACRPCHERVYQQWAASPHARSLDDLSTTERRDPRCLGCHSTGAAARLQGVQCEACHGPGRLYAVDYLMRDRPVAAALGLADPDEELCRRCHTPDSPAARPYDHETMLPQVKHEERW